MSVCEFIHRIQPCQAALPHPYVRVCMYTGLGISSIASCSNLTHPSHPILSIRRVRSAIGASNSACSRQTDSLGPSLLVGVDGTIAAAMVEQDLSVPAPEGRLSPIRFDSSLQTDDLEVVVCREVAVETKFAYKVIGQRRYRR